jgi:hypothetical protein
VARVVELYLRVRIVALECFGSLRQKKWIVLAPNSQQRRPLCPEIFLDFRI